MSGCTILIVSSSSNRKHAAGPCLFARARRRFGSGAVVGSVTAGFLPPRSGLRSVVAGSVLWTFATGSAAAPLPSTVVELTPNDPNHAVIIRAIARRMAGPGASADQVEARAVELASMIVGGWMIVTLVDGLDDDGEFGWWLRAMFWDGEEMFSSLDELDLPPDFGVLLDW